MEQEKKLILLEHYFLYVVDDGAKNKTHSVITLLFYVVYDAGREKTHTFITLFFVYSLGWSIRKNSFRYNIIDCILSMMKKEEKFILLQRYFLYLVFHEAR